MVLMGALILASGVLAQSAEPGRKTFDTVLFEVPRR